MSEMQGLENPTLPTLPLTCLPACFHSFIQIRELSHCHCHNGFWFYLHQYGYDVSGWAHNLLRDGLKALLENWLETIWCWRLAQFSSTHDPLLFEHLLFARSKYDCSYYRIDLKPSKYESWTRFKSPIISFINFPNSQFRFSSSLFCWNGKMKNVSNLDRWPEWFESPSKSKRAYNVRLNRRLKFETSVHVFITQQQQQDGR